MLRNYFITALRNLWKYRFYSILNILGLAIGIASSLIMLSFVRSEWSYDRFHPDYQDIYRLIFKADIGGTAAEFPVVGYPWLGWALEEIPQIEKGTHFFGGVGEEILIKEEVIWEENLLYADSTFSHIFNLKWLSGNKTNFLNSPNQAIITQSIAQKYFGQEDPIGKSFIINHWSGEIPITVSGLVEDYPAQSHFDLGILISMPTLQQTFGKSHAVFNNPSFTSFYTYIKSREPDMAQTKLSDIFNRRMDEEAKQRIKAIHLQALTDIHLRSHTNVELKNNGNILYVRIFLMVGILILFVAAINYINLATALAEVRLKEVGVRKVVGGLGRNITQQFLGESCVLALISIVFGVLLAEVMRLYLGKSMGIYISMNYFSDSFILLLLLAFGLFIGLVAGSYPALILANVNPVAVFRSSITFGNKGRYLRQILLFVQFIIASALIIGAGIISKQLNYIENMDMGFERLDQVVIPAPILSDFDQTLPLLERLKERAKELTGVKDACLTGSVPGQNRSLLNVRVAGRPETEIHSPVVIPVDFNYVETMDLKILHGRKFDPSYGEDKGQAVLINETSAIQIALDSPYINTELLILPQQGTGIDTIERVKIIGVYQDMHFEPLYRTIHPMFLRVQPQDFFHLVVRLQPDHQETTITQLKGIWEAQVNDTPFEYTFLHEDIAVLYEQEDRLGKLINLLTILTILIACIGLFSFLAFTVVKRQKEMMIRKVIGASIGNIIVLLAKPFLWLILIAFPFAAILAWWATNQWLETFAYHTSAGIFPFLLALVLITLIGVITISYHAYKAAIVNPTDYLHQE